MNHSDFNELVTTPMFMAVTAFVVVVLIALTMRSVVKRQQAMIRRKPFDALAQNTYTSRWRDGLSA